MSQSSNSVVWQRVIRDTFYALTGVFIIVWETVRGVPNPYLLGVALVLLGLIPVGWLLSGLKGSGTIGDGYYSQKPTSQQ